MKKTLLTLSLLALLWSCNKPSAEEGNTQEVASSMPTSTETPQGTPSEASSTDASTAVANTDGKYADLKFDELVYDFGKVKEGTEVKHTFTFTNVGEIPLTITNVTASCGCTVPDWEKTPVAPGAKSKIDVVFNSAGKEGSQSKDITVSANTKTGTSVATIKGIVEAATPTSKRPGGGPAKQ